MTNIVFPAPKSIQMGESNVKSGRFKHETHRNNGPKQDKTSRSYIPQTAKPGGSDGEEEQTMICVTAQESMMRAEGPRKADLIHSNA